PAFFFIQGAHCGSIDNMDSRWPVAKMLEGISRKGYVVIKTEKSGVGDSRNDIHCRDCDLLYEIGLFSASYNQLAKYDFIDLENVFIFGHSMGGIQAPLLNTENPPRGIAVFGTVARPWFEYYLDIVRKQRLLLGQDYLENEANHESAVRFFYNLMVEKKSPREMEMDEVLRDFMHNQWPYDGEDRFHGRNYIFWQQLQDTRLFSAWAGTPAHVLSIWGEGEYVAVNSYEHELIADIVNHYNPGKARYLKLATIDHGFVKVDDLQHAIAVRTDWNYQYNNFNHDIVEVLHEWMQEVIK
ncbi:MAG: alpha/beta hydrolase family protein, partial [Bacteroidota bacterium]